MPIPAGPGTCLVLIQSRFALHSFKTGFNHPPHARDAHDAGELGVLWGKNDVIGKLVGVIKTAPGREPTVKARLDQRGERGMLGAQLP